MASIPSPASAPGRSLALIALCLGALAAACSGGGPPSVVPPELVGMWTTTDERYADRALQVTETSLVFHTGPEKQDVSAYTIKSVRLESTEPDRHYVIEYADLAGTSQLDVYFEPGSWVLRFVNQPLMVWTREPAEASGGDRAEDASGTADAGEPGA